jgi:NADH:ubiquinone oxidoreductase subunit 5 (chain L)/Multisubunit Na+/H+ antiporter, MnhA subunit
MDKISGIMTVLIWLPLIGALLACGVNHYAFRNAVVWVVGAILAGTSLILFNLGPGQYQPAGYWNSIVEIADFGLMIFIMYIGIQRRHTLIMILTLVQMAVLIYYEFFMGIHATVNPVFVLDHFAVLMSLIINIIGSLICIYGVRYIAEHEEQHPVGKTRQPRFMFWLMAFIGAMNGLVFSNDLFWLFFFWELTTLCSYQLISHNLDEEAIRNACRALWMNMLGGVAFALALVSLAYALPGQPLSMSTLLNLPNGIHHTIFFAVILLVIAGFTKAAQMPFQSWLLGAMVAPTPVSALLHSSTMVKAGVYLIIRLAPVYRGTYISDLVAAAGAFTFMMASVLAVTQSNAKRVLAYSTIANLGLIIACAGVNTSVAISAAIVLIIFHAVSKGLLFLSVGVIEHNIGSRDIENMGGLIDRMPVSSVIVAIGVLSMFLPPFGMLVGKWASIEAAVNLPLVALMLVIASAVTTVFWIKWLGRLFESKPGLTHAAPEHLAVHYWVSLGGLALGAIIMSIMVVPVINHIIAPIVGTGIHGTGLIVKGLSIVTEPAVIVMGSFTGWPLFLVIAGAMLGVGIYLKPSNAKVQPIYLCGENTGINDSIGYMSTADQEVQSSLASYYFTGFLSEPKITRTGNVIAIILLVFLVVGVKTLW